MATTITRPSPAPVEVAKTLLPHDAGSWARPLSLLAPDLAALIVLVLAARALEGAPLARMVLFGGLLLVVRRAASVAWAGSDPVVPSLSTSRRRATCMAAALGLAVVIAGLPLALSTGHGLALVAVAVAFVPAVLVPLEHRASLTCARSSSTLAALTGAGVTLVVGIALLRLAPSASLAPVVALAAGDPVALALLRHRRHGGECRLAPRHGTATPLDRRRSPATAGLASLLIGSMPMLALVSSLRPGSDKTLLGALVVLGLFPPLAAGIAPVLLVRNVAAGRREALAPGLLLSATAGSVVALAALVGPGALVNLSEDRVALHLAYFSVAMAGVGMAHVLVHSRVRAGAGRTAVVLAGLAVIVQLILTATGTGTSADVAVDAAVGAIAVLLVSLGIATAVATPVPLVVPAEEAAGGPRLVGWLVLGLTTVAVGIRMATARDLWLDEALTARVTNGSFMSMFSSASAADAHPPLQMVLSWAARQAFGPSAFSLRLPSLLAGVLLIPLLYLVGTELYDRRAGLAAAAIGTFAPTLVWFSSEARPAAITMLLALLALFTMLCSLRCGRASDWVLFGLAGAALIWAHQLALVHLAVLHGAVAVALVRRRKDAEPAMPGFAGWTAALTILVLAAVPLIALRSGVGPPRILPPLEYATAAAPGGETSVFPLIGALLSGVLGFHPVGVTSRLLALWPLGILGALLVLGRRRSEQAPLLLVLATAPVAAVLMAQLLGSPRRPTFALAWFATAIPALILVLSRGITMIGGRWSTTRLVIVATVSLLVAALADQTARVRPLDRFDVNPAISEVAATARRGDLIVYEPKALGDLVRYEAPGVEARVLGDDGIAPKTAHRRIVVIAAFSLGDPDESIPRVVDFVKDVSATRSLRSEKGKDVKVWTFE